MGNIVRPVYLSELEEIHIIYIVNLLISTKNMYIWLVQLIMLLSYASLLLESISLSMELELTIVIVVEVEYVRKGREIKIRGYIKLVQLYVWRLILSYYFEIT